jgi:hypothetical protein
MSDERAAPSVFKVEAGWGPMTSGYGGMGISPVGACGKDT